MDEVNLKLYLGSIDVSELDKEFTISEIFCASRTASVIPSPPSEVTTYIKSPTGPRKSGPLSNISSPNLIPFRQPTLPALQSVSQPALVAIVSERAKSSPANNRLINTIKWLGTM